jgi:hypothetical protein
VWTWVPPTGPEKIKISIRSTATIFCRTIIPGVFFVWLYVVNLRQMTIGGGHSQPYFRIIVQTLSLSVGGPFDAPGAYPASIASVLITLAAFWNVFKQAPRRATFYLCVTLIFPALILALAPREDIYPRYFLISVLFLLMLWSDFLGNVCRQSAIGKWWIGIALAAFIVANGWHIADLIWNGRAHYQEAIQTIEQQTQAEHAVVLVDHPGRHIAMLGFYGNRLPMPKPIEVFLLSPEEIAPAEWILTHDLDPGFVPPQKIAGPSRSTFDLIRHYQFAGLSGWQLNLYYREPAAK